MSWRRGDGLEDDSFHRKGKCQNEGLDALGKNGVATVEDDNVNQAGKKEEQVDGEEEEKLWSIGGKTQGC